MKTSHLLLGLLLVGAWSSAQGLANDQSKKTYPTTGSIEVLDPQLHLLIDPGAKIEVLADGFAWAEGPVWVQDGNYLLFSDIPNNRIVKWSEAEGARTYLKPSGYTGSDRRAGEPGSNGLLLDSQGHLVLCQHGDRRMARMDAPLSAPAPRFITLADRYEGKRLSSPNDAVFHRNGDLYFTDPPYGLEKNVDDPAKELPFQGVYRVSRDGKVTLLTKELERPNGICFSPDYKTLYVANSYGERPVWLTFPVKADGTLGKSKVFFDARTLLAAGRAGGNDGMKVDAAGNVFATGPGGVLIFTAGGKHLGTILTGERTANCAFGDDGKTLYMTADHYLMRVRLKSKIALQDFIRANVATKKEIDVFLHEMSWAQFDPVVGYILGNYMPRDGIDGSRTLSTVQPNGARTSFMYKDRACRINTYGNSFTQCHQVSDGETWQEYLAAHLGEPIRNFGMGGFGVYQAYRRMLREEQTENGAKYVMLYIWGDDHVRSLFRCRYMATASWNRRQNDDEGIGRMFHGNFWSNMEMNLKTGELEEHDSRISNPEDLYQMTDREWMVILGGGPQNP